MNTNNFLTNIPVKVLDSDGEIHNSNLQLNFDLTKQKLTVNSKVEPSQNHTYPDAHVVYDLSSRLGSITDRKASLNPERYMLQLEILASAVISDFVQGLYAKVEPNQRLTDKMSIDENEKCVAIANIAAIVDKTSEFKPVVKLHHIDKYGDDYVGILNVNGSEMEFATAEGKINLENDPKSIMLRVIRNHPSEVLSDIRSDIKDYNSKQFPRTSIKDFER